MMRFKYRNTWKVCGCPIRGGSFRENGKKLKRLRITANEQDRRQELSICGTLSRAFPRKNCEINHSQTAVFA